jgi:ankyrin repeat protein
MGALSFAPHTLALVTEIIAIQTEHNSNDDCHEIIMTKPLSIDVHADLDKASCLELSPILTNLPLSETNQGGESPNQNNFVAFDPLCLRNCDGETPFFVASKSCNLAGMKLLMSQEHINLNDNYSTSALHNICKNHLIDNHHEALNYLIQHGAQINAYNLDSQTPLHIAASRGCLQCIHTLLENGACPSMVNENGNTALHLVATRHNKISLIDALSNAQACSPSCVYCITNTVDEALITETDTRSNSYQCHKFNEPVALACINNISHSRAPVVDDTVLQTTKNFEIWDAFFQNMRAESYLPKSSSSLSPLQNDSAIDVDIIHLQGKVEEDDEEEVTLLVDNDGNSFLHQAVIRGDIETMISLLEKGAPTDVRNHANQTALGICFEKGFKDGSSLILKYKHVMKEPGEQKSGIENDLYVQQSVLDNDSIFFHLATLAFSVVENFAVRFFYLVTQLFKNAKMKLGL